MTFKEWIVSFRDQEHPYEEIAEMISEDKEFPNDNDYEEILAYVHNLTDLNHKTMVEAIKDYRKYRNKEK